MLIRRRIGRLAPLLVALSMLFPLGLSSAQAGTRQSYTDNAWPQFGYGPAHNGWNYKESAINAGNASTLMKSWSSGSGGQQGDDIVAGGSVFFTTAGKLVAVDLSTGATQWTLPWTGLSDPSYAGGVLFATDYTATNQLKALDPATGKTLWTATGPSLSWPTVANGTVFISSFNRLLAFRGTDGHPLWATTLEKCPRGIKGCELYVNAVTPAEYDGLVYVTSHSQYLYAVGAAHGKIAWHSESLNPGSGHPVDDSGRVTVEVSQGHVLILTTLRVISVNHSTGHIQWTYSQGNFHAVAIANGMAAADGLVFETGLGDGPHGANPSGEALDLATGKPKWGFTTYGYAAQAPSVANGLLYAEDDASDVFVYNVGTGARVTVITGVGTYGPTYPAVVGFSLTEANYDFTLSG